MDVGLAVMILDLAPQKGFSTAYQRGRHKNQVFSAFFWE
jgi:hypothetical protein